MDMSRIVIVILIYHRHKAIDHVYTEINDFIENIMHVLGVAGAWKRKATSMHFIT
jgi:hypothetical protein